MDPITAAAQAITALASLYGKILDTIPEAQKAQMAIWFVQDMRNLRAFFKIPDVPPLP